jgi:hypothetical protein
VDIVSYFSDKQYLRLERNYGGPIFMLDLATSNFE